MIRREWIFIILVTLLNLFQAGLTELSGDEALYWMYSKNLDWAFKDHPPMIGLFDGLGYLFFQNELGVRLMVVFAQAVTLWCIFRLVPVNRSKWFLLALFSLPILHVYGFIATPDAPLLMFTGLYLIAWRSFLNDQSVRNTLVLGFLMSMLVWSKYHGFLVIILVFLPHRRMWFNGKFWLASLFGVILFIPHIIWQIRNDLPTIKFHLVQRSGSFSFDHVWDFVGGELLVFNPVIIGLLIWVLLKTKAQNEFDRSLRWMVTGFLIIFLFSSTRGRVEPHWTAAAAIPALILVSIFFRQENISRGLKWSLAFFSLVIVVGRVNLVSGTFPVLAREFITNKEKMETVFEVAGVRPVCFMNSYQDPSLYMFYGGTYAHSVNNISGGKNQFDYWDYSKYFHHREFLSVSNSQMDGFTELKINDKRSVYILPEADMPIAHKLYLVTEHWKINARVGETVRIKAVLKNRNLYDWQFSDPAHQFKWKGVFNYKKENQVLFQVELHELPGILKAGESVEVECSFVVPDMKGTNKGGIALGIDKLPMTYQSNWIRLVIE